MQHAIMPSHQQGGNKAISNAINKTTPGLRPPPPRPTSATHDACYHLGLANSHGVPFSAGRSPCGAARSRSPRASSGPSCSNRSGMPCAGRLATVAVPYPPRSAEPLQDQHRQDCRQWFGKPRRGTWAGRGWGGVFDTDGTSRSKSVHIELR